MKAIKENKVYTIDEAQKKDYIAQGYDIVDDEGTVIEHGAGKTVSYEEHLKAKKELEEKNKVLVDENKKLKAEIKELKKGAN